MESKTYGIIINRVDLITEEEESQIYLQLEQ